MLVIFIINITLNTQRKINKTCEMVTKRKTPKGVKTLRMFLMI